VYIGEGAVLHVVAPSRAKREPEAVLAGARPEVWVADLSGSQQGHGERGQVCLAHQLRDVQYALDAGDAVFAPAMLAWLQRAIKVGRKRERVKDVTLQRHRRDLRKRLEEILQLEPEQADGKRLRQRYAKCKEGLLVFVTDREVPFTNNESERALRPSVIFRKVTNGSRSEWGAEFFAAVRSVIGTGRLHGLSPFEPSQ
jgi:transposase